MALVKCKECGEDVSTQAKACPKCGAKPPKKTSLFTWLVLGLIIFGVYAANKTPSSVISAKSSTPQISKPSATIASGTKKTEPLKSSWTTVTSKDEMTGKKSSYAASPSISPIKKMDFPYHNTEAWLGVGCDSESEWSYIGFNKSPNLADTETKDGFSLINTRIKWDGKVEDITLSQKWGASFIHFERDSATIKKIINSSSALLELQWYGQQPSYFNFPLDGARAAVEKIRAECSAKNKTPS